MNLLDRTIVRDGGRLRGVRSILKVDRDNVLDFLSELDLFEDGSPGRLRGVIYFSRFRNSLKIFWWTETDLDECVIDSTEYEWRSSANYINLYLRTQDKFYCIGSKDCDYAKTTYQLENYYLPTRYTISTDSCVGITSDGVVMEIRVEDDQCTETPVKRGVEFDDWLDSEWPFIISHRDGITRISEGSVIILDMEIVPTHVSFMGWCDYVIADGSDLRIVYRKDLSVVATKQFLLESPVVQLECDIALCEDGTIWKLRRSCPPELIDHVSEVIYPPNPRRKQPTC